MSKACVIYGRYGAALLILALLLVGGLRAIAQSEDEVWETPINLSQSGVATNLTYALDGEQNVHAIWLDAFIGAIIMNNVGGAWNAPVAITVPFSEPPFFRPSNEDFEQLYRPIIVGDSNNRLHTFWDDGDGALLYSRVTFADVANPAAWTFPQRLSVSGIPQVAAVDENGRVHLGFVRQLGEANAPAGLYYVQSPDGGVSWSEARLLYTSGYLRALNRQNIGMKIAVGLGGRVFVSWNNPIINTVFFSQSGDGGVSWPEPQVVDARQAEDLPESPGPSQLDMVADGNVVHLSWQAAHGDGLCTQYHSFSLDGGLSWDGPNVALSDPLLGCPLRANLLLNPDGLFFLLTEYETTAYLQSWDGGQWSEPEVQAILPELIDEETFREVRFTCLHPLVTRDNRLFVLGCGENDLVVGDVWQVERPLGSLTDWFGEPTPTPVWSQPIPISNINFEVEAPVMVLDSTGLVHAFWSQSTALIGDEVVGSSLTTSGNAIYYTRLDAERWTPPRAIIAAPSGKAEQPAVVADGRGALLAVWSGGDAGTIFFGRAPAERASSAVEWGNPVLVPAPHAVGSRPDILVDMNGVAYVTYAIPFNEDRGIYLTSTGNNGETWAEPITVFDAEAAGWAMVDGPRLAQTSDQTLHLFWTRARAPLGSGASALYYARSEDGQRWSDDQIMAEGLFLWHDIVAVGNRVLHQVWLEIDQERTFLWHQISRDNGLTWSDAAPVSEATIVQGGAATILLDAAHVPHLFQLAEDINGSLILQEWVWLDDSWQIGQRLQISENILSDDEISLEANGIAAIADLSNRIDILYTTLVRDVIDQEVANNIYYTSRQNELLLDTPTPLPSLTPTPTATPDANDTLEITPTPTLAFPLEPDVGGVRIGPLNTNDTVGAIVISVIPALLLVAGIFVIGFRARRLK